MDRCDGRTLQTRSAAAEMSCRREPAPCLCTRAGNSLARRETTIAIDFRGRRVEHNRAAARAMLDDRRAFIETWHRSGEAAEYALERYIHRTQYNEWPSKTERKELYTHDLRALFERTGLDRTAMPPNTGAALLTAFGWDRDRACTLDRLARTEARATDEAVVRSEGLLEWLRNH